MIDKKLSLSIIYYWNVVKSQNHKEINNLRFVFEKIRRNIEKRKLIGHLVIWIFSRMSSVFFFYFKCYINEFFFNWMKIVVFF